MSGYRELMRRKLLEDVYDRMTPEEKRLFIQLTMQNRDHQKILQALQSQQTQLQQIHRSQSWLQDFGANIAGNAVWDGAAWLLSRLIKRL